MRSSRSSSSDSSGLLSWTEVGLIAVFLVPAVLIALWVRLLRRELRNDAETKKKLQ
jgi:hypothetical protein